MHQGEQQKSTDRLIDTNEAALLVLQDPTTKNVLNYSQEWKLQRLRNCNLLNRNWPVYHEVTKVVPVNQPPKAK